MTLLAAAFIAAGIASMGGLAGCSTISDTLAPAKVDYKAAAAKTAALDVPPDLTQLSDDPRYQPPTGATVSANALQAAGQNPQTAQRSGAVQAVAPERLGKIRIERDGNTRWLVTPLAPEQLWPKLRAFWQQNGFALETDKPELGVMETEWKENRAKIPQDIIRRTLGTVIDSIYDSGERDRYRTRIERSAAGTEIYISHRGAEEVYVTSLKDQTRWQMRPSSPDLEAEMLGRLMYQLTATDDVTAATAKTQAAAMADQVKQVPSTQARARVIEGGPGAALQFDEDFERAWRRVGSSLDRSGFTVEDRDRSQGLYYVRYVDPKLAGKEDPGFFSRLFGGKKEELAGQRFRLLVQGQGKSSSVSIQDSQGVPQNSDSARNIVKFLVEDLR
jgi:outer membrane protein assembly factor BamC